MTAPKIKRPAERVLHCISQYEGVGASASEVSDELQLPLHEVMGHVEHLAEEGSLVRTRTLRPWKHNASQDLTEMRRVYVAEQFREEAI